MAELGIKGKAVSPFGMLSLDDAPERHILRAINYSKFNFPHKQLSLPKSTFEKSQRLRIGYFSADFYNHATMFLMARFFSCMTKHNLMFSPILMDLKPWIICVLT